MCSVPVLEIEFGYQLIERTGLGRQRLRVLPRLQCRTTMAVPTCGSYLRTSGHSRSKPADQHSCNERLTRRYTFPNSHLDSQHPTRTINLQHHYPRNKWLRKRTRTRAPRQDRARQRHSSTARTNGRTSIDRKLYDALLRLRV
jgi:hypothetical protein